MHPSHIQFADIMLKWNRFLTIFGLCNLKEVGRNENKIRYVVSSLKVAYTLFIIALFSFLFYIEIKWTYWASSRYLGSGVLHMYSTYSGLPIATLIILINLIQSKRYSALLSNLFRLESKFYTCNTMLVSVRSTKLFVSFSMILILSFICDLFWIHFDGVTYGKAFALVVSYIYFLYNFLSIVYFSMLQYWLEKCFGRIYFDLVHFCKPELNYLKKGDVALDFINEVMNVQLSDGPPFRVTDDRIITVFEKKQYRPVAQEIKRLRIIYCNIFKMSCEINNLFSNTNLIVVFVDFVFGIVLLFGALKSLFVYTKSPELVILMDLIMCIKGSLLSLSTISGLVWTCGAACSEAKKIPLAIQDILIFISDPDVKLELKEFAEQLKHERIYFSPHGFFTLENSMLLSMVAAVASYLIILLQFHPLDTPLST